MVMRALWKYMCYPIMIAYPDCIVFCENA